MERHVPGDRSINEVRMFAKGIGLQKSILGSMQVYFTSLSRSGEHGHNRLANHPWTLAGFCFARYQLSRGGL